MSLPVRGAGCKLTCRFALATVMGDGSPLGRIVQKLLVRTCWWTLAGAVMRMGCRLECVEVRWMLLDGGLALAAGVYLFEELMGPLGISGTL